MLGHFNIDNINLYEFFTKPFLQKKFFTQCKHAQVSNVLNILKKVIVNTDFNLYFGLIIVGYFDELTHIHDQNNFIILTQLTHVHVVTIRNANMPACKLAQK